MYYKLCLKFYFLLLKFYDVTIYNIKICICCLNVELTQSDLVISWVSFEFKKMTRSKNWIIRVHLNMCLVHHCKVYFKVFFFFCLFNVLKYMYLEYKICLILKFIMTIVVEPIVVKHCSLINIVMGPYVWACPNGKT